MFTNICVMYREIFPFIGHHKLPWWEEGQKIFLQILCTSMCACVCASVHFSRAELFESMHARTRRGCTSHRMGPAATAGAVIDFHRHLSPEDSPCAFTVLRGGHAWPALPVSPLCPLSPLLSLKGKEEYELWLWAQRERNCSCQLKAYESVISLPLLPNNWHVDMT